MENWKKYKVNLPTGECGSFRITRRVFKREQELSLRNLRDTLEGRGMVAGRYTVLSFKPGKPYTDIYGVTSEWQVMMSDTRAEIMDHLPFIQAAKGDVLVAGLGLGVVLKALIAKPNVSSVIVLEKSPDVIKLVASHYKHKKARIIQADAFTWVPDREFDCAWFDIWPTIDSRNLTEMKALHRRYKRWVSYTSAWCEHECKAAEAERKHWKDVMVRCGNIRRLPEFKRVVAAARALETT